MNCECGSNLIKTKCCLPFINNEVEPETAVELMRARYTAYTQINMDYIAQTHDPKTRKKNDMEANREWAEETEWLGLEIIDAIEGQRDDEVGQVEFKAKFKTNDIEEVHHERSRFNKRQGKWYFTDGQTLPDKAESLQIKKTGRNEACPCGSGKKFKKCCG